MNERFGKEKQRAKYIAALQKLYFEIILSLITEMYT